MELRQRGARARVAFKLAPLATFPVVYGAEWVLSLASGELGLCTLGLVIAHGVTLGRRGFWGVLPFVCVAAAWWLGASVAGFGVRGSALYVSPLVAPGAVLAMLVENLPCLLFAAWVMPGIAACILLSGPGLWALATFALAVLAVMARRLAPVAHDPRLRFCALGSLLACLPAALTLPHERLLVVADLAAAGLLALVAEHVRGLVQVRLLASVLLSVAYAASLHQHLALSERPLDALLRAADPARERLVFVNPPASYYLLMLPAMLSLRGAPPARGLHMLTPGIYPTAWRRLDAHSLEASSDQGLVQPLGRYRSEVGQHVGALSPVYAAQRLTQLGARERFDAGERVRLGELDVEVCDVTPDGLPRRVRFRFDHPLEDAGLRFVAWEEGAWRPFRLPTIGETRELAPVLH